MTHPNFTLLYVEDPVASAAFYTRLFGGGPVEASPTFVMFALDKGLMLGLWARHTVEPKATAPGGVELGLVAPDKAAVDAKCQEWSGLGVKIIQPPTELDFGRAFTAVDPDGHRLRVFAPND